uniref:Clarin 3 n=1 Tax=Eptatretus burgeri TaxID=7764 RepID=A0A8C4N421_EPTBU
MVSVRKRVHFLLACAASLCTLGLLVVSMGLQEWIMLKSQCPIASSIVTYFKSTYGLFSGMAPALCLIQAPSFYSVPSTLFKDGSKTNQGLYVTVLVLLALGILSALFASVLSFYNGVTNPYVTLHGPRGLYVWNSICFVSCLLVLILHALNVQCAGLSVVFALSMKNNTTEELRLENTFLVCYWLVLAAMLTCLIPIGLTYFYYHLKRREVKLMQFTNPAVTKDIMMY